MASARTKLWIFHNYTCDVLVTKAFVLIVIYEKLSVGLTSNLTKVTLYLQGASFECSSVFFKLQWKGLGISSVCSLSELLNLAVGKHFSLLLCKIVSVQKAADQIQASVLPKQDYCLEVTHTTVTSGKNLHVGLHLLIKFPHWGTDDRTVPAFGSVRGNLWQMGSGKNGWAASRGRLLLELLNVTSPISF